MPTDKHLVHNIRQLAKCYYKPGQTRGKRSDVFFLAKLPRNLSSRDAFAFYLPLLCLC